MEIEAAAQEVAMENEAATNEAALESEAATEEVDELETLRARLAKHPLHKEIYRKTLCLFGNGDLTFVWQW